MIYSMYHDDSFEFMRGMSPNSVDVAILDPPYSERQHRGVRSSRRNKMRDADTFACRTKRTVDLGFDHFTREQCFITCSRLLILVKRWSIIFCDDDLLPVWRACAARAGLQVIRTGVWRRLGGAPQFTGDRPASGVEFVVILHRPGRKRWNGGGHPAAWSFEDEMDRPVVWLEHPIVANRAGHRSDRVHTTQKPLALMLELVRLFSNEGEIVFDPFAGSGTTGVAAIRLGRQFVGIERMGEHYATALSAMQAEARGLDRVVHVAGKQQSIFDVMEPGVAALLAQKHAENNQT